MKKEYATEQESFWAGEFGTEYVQRNKSQGLLASNLAFFTRALRATNRIDDCIEFGANIGMNLRALKLLYPQQEQYAIEINEDAVKELASIVHPDNVYHSSIMDYSAGHKFDLALIKGVLIHINPEFLPQVYDKLYDSASRYILICEYYNPTPTKINYRGFDDRLFKRDFCGEIMDRYGDLELIDYGFSYHRDPKHPQDDINWFLLEKR